MTNEQKLFFIIELKDTLLTLRLYQAVAFLGEKIHGAKFFNIKFRCVNFLLKIKNLKINTIKLIYSCSSGGIFRLNFDRGISQWMPTHDQSDFCPRTISNLEVQAKTRSEPFKTAIKKGHLLLLRHVLRIAFDRITREALRWTR